MKVILREDVTDVGQAGQTVEVKPGYGRNFLIPRNLAIPATSGNLKAIGEIGKQKEIRARKWSGQRLKNSHCPEKYWSAKRTRCLVR
jgi:ribosomal protein L9